MPLDLNQPYGQVSGETPDSVRYVQNGVHYQANRKVCKGSVDPDAIPEEKQVRTAASMAEEAAELTRRAQAATESAAAAEAAEAQRALETAPVNQQPEIDPEIKPDPVEDDQKIDVSDGELSIVEQLDGDIGKNNGDPYASRSVAKRAIGDEEGLKVIRVEGGYLLRRAA